MPKSKEMENKDKMTERYKERVEELKHYVQHAPDCSSIVPANMEKCDCGLDAILEIFKEEEK